MRLAHSTFGGTGAEVLALFFGIACGQEIGRYVFENCARSIPARGAGLLVLFGTACLLR